MERALVLAAGGVTGALYEVGVLRALEERHGPLHELFDLFIGVSAGATVAAFVSQGVSPARLHAALLVGDDPFFPLRQRDVAAMDLRRAARLAGTAARFAAHALQRLLRGGSAGRWGPGVPLPAGLLSIEPYRRFVEETLRAGGLSDDFRSLARPLLVPATDLDSARRIAARVSLLVGTCLVALNQGDVLLAMLAHGAALAPSLAWKIPLTYLVPFLVSWHASAAATRS